MGKTRSRADKEIKHLSKVNTKKKQIKHKTSRCPNCGKKGNHIFPASFGQKGFFMCEELYP